jgi:hypothetical protein
MDPNIALEDIRKAIASTAIDPSRTDFDDVLYQAGIVAFDAFEALDEWLSKGGFLPSAWVNGR